MTSTPERAAVRSLAPPTRDTLVAERLERWPDVANAGLVTDHNLIGRIQRRLGNADAARASFEAAAAFARLVLAVESHSADTLSCLFDNLHELGDVMDSKDLDTLDLWREAADVSQRWVAAEPKDVNAHRALGDALRKLSRRLPPDADPNELYAVRKGWER